MRDFYSRFLESVETWPENVAVEMRHSSPPGQDVAVERYTYAELRRMAESVGRWLRDQEMPLGARSAILAANGPRWVAAYLGTIAAGGVAVPFDTAFSAEQIAKLLRDSDSGCLFTDRKHLAIAQRAIAGLDILLVLLDGNADGSPALDAILAAGPGDFTPAELGRDDPAVILYTSGTTSDPKGVLLTHDNLLGEMDAVFPVLEVGPTDAILGVLPLFHALAQMANLLLPFARGARVVYLESLNVTDLLRALRDSNVTLFCCVPQFFYLIHERILKQVKQRSWPAQMMFGLLMRISKAARRLGINLGKLFFRQAHAALGAEMRFLITGGSRFDAAIGHELEALGFDILQAYGLTETSGGATVTRPEDNVIGSVGRPLNGVEVKIVDPEPLEEGPPTGEIAIRGRIVMQGYWNRPDATATVIRDGWLHTGDLGYLDASGNLFITGRRKEIIVLSSGKNIYPEEIEAHYRKSPYVKEICVAGLEARPGEPQAERLHAVIVPNEEVLRERKIVNINEVIRFDIDGLSAQLPSTKRILSYEIWQDELPKTTTRKLKRFEIQQRVGQGSGAGAAATAGRTFSDEDLAWAEQPGVASALAVVREHSHNQREINPNDSLELDLGLDSMERVELLVALEQELHAHVEESVTSEVYTVRDLVEAVRAAAGTAIDRKQSAGWDAVLAAEPDDPEVLNVARPPGVASALWYLGCRFLYLFCRDACQLQVTGLEKLPEQGPYIICPNHQSFLDAPVVLSLLPWTIFSQVFHLGTSEIWGWGWRRRLARSLRLIPVDPDSNLVAGMRAGAYGLRRGRILILYPEGQRSIDGTPKTFKKGAAILSIHLRVPIYPVAIDGFHEVWPRGKPPQRISRLSVRFGDPIIPPPLSNDSEAAYAELTAELRRQVVQMWEELHRKKEEKEKVRRQAAAAD
ncbi:MAG TPA: AMP-binding protein [Terriglobales bacterium]|nr:AMP-binding protein [Terriglobales bacterium]